MSSAPQALVHPDQESLVAAVAARLLTRLVDLHAAGTVPSVVLTGGGVGISVLRELATHPARDAVDWARLDLYWGDERFLPAGHADRNETQAWDALLSRVPVDPARVHPMAPSDGPHGDDVDAAATAYAELLARVGGDRAVPAFDVCLLGIGPEGHTASVFPGSPAVHATTETVVGVRDCPKPPPTRISLTLPALRHSVEVLLVVAGESKADAVAGVFSGTDEVAIPAAGARGTQHTRWLLDRAAAAQLPPHP